MSGRAEKAGVRTGKVKDGGGRGRVFGVAHS